MTGPTRQNAGDAVAELFGRRSVTGGLAGDDTMTRAPVVSPPSASAPDEDGGGGDARRPEPVERSARSRGGSRLRSVSAEPRVRVGVELSEPELAFLRSVSRPARTGGPRTLGGKFVATGVLAAAIELLQTSPIDMHGVAAGDLDEMTARARTALLRASEARSK